MMGSEGLARIRRQDVLGRGTGARCSLVFVGGNFAGKAISSGWRLELRAVNAGV